MTSNTHDKRIRGSGIYAIKNRVSGQLYVGQAQYIGGRWRYHRTKLKAGIHHNQHLQRAYKKYGKEAFEFCVLECCEIAALGSREQFWIDEHQGHLYNMCQASASRRGSKLSDEAKRKLSSLYKGIPLRPEHRERIRLSKLGKPRPWTEEWRAKLVPAFLERARRPMSDEHKAKISAALKAKRCAA